MTANVALSDCPVCGGALVRQEDSFDAHVGRRVVAVPGTYTRCTVCREFLFAPGEMDDVLRRASDAIRGQENLLGPSEIRAIRMGLGLTQSQLEQLLGTGPKTVVRWEKGTVFQNSGTNTLLEILRDVPEAAEYLFAKRGVDRKVVPLRPKLRNVSYSYAAIPVQPQLPEDRPPLVPSPTKPVPMSAVPSAGDPVRTVA